MSTLKRYYGGLGVSEGGGAVRKLLADNFAEFVGSYIAVPHQIQLTKAEFLALPKSERDLAKDGPYFCACSFKDGTTKRSNANADKLEIICYDIDSPAESKGVYTRNLAEAPDAILDRMHPYNVVVYHTSNSTPEDPRLRVLIDVETCDIAYHRRAVNHFAAMLGLPNGFKGITESTTISQPMYRPAQFLKSPYDAVLCSRVDGVAFDVADLPEPTEEEAGNESRRYAGDFDSEGCGLAFLPVPDLKVEDLREPLFKIDPDIGRNEWVFIGMSLAHQFYTEEDAREAYELFLEWSATALTKFSDEETTYAAWKSFKPYATHRDPVTIRSLFHYAKLAGWDNGKVAATIKKSVLEWLAKCEDEDELMEDGCKRIAAMPFVNEMVEESLINALRDRIAAVSGKPKLTIASIKKQLSNIRFIKRKETLSTNIPGWLQPFKFVGPENVFRDATNGRILTPAGFDNFFSEQLMPSDTDSDQAKSGRPAVLPTAFALNQVKIQRVDGCMYNPTHNGSEPIFKWENLVYLNTYLPSSTPPLDRVNSKAAGALFCDHIHKLIGNPECEKLLIDFLCHVVQFPGKKIRWLPTIQSAEGAGKGFIHDIMGAVLGSLNVKSISPGILSETKYNDWMIDRVFIVIDEVHVSGENREATTNALKIFISDDKVPVHAKYESPRNYPNFANAIAFSNYKNGFHIKASDRRYFINESPIQTEADVAELTATGHFERLEILKKSDGWGGALRHWMLRHKIAKDFPVNGPAPRTEARRTLIHESKNGIQLAIEDLINDPAEVLVMDDLILDSHLVMRLGSLLRDAPKHSNFLLAMGYHRVEQGRKILFDSGHSSIVWASRTFDPEWGDVKEQLELRLGMETEI